MHKFKTVSALALATLMFAPLALVSLSSAADAQGVYGFRGAGIANSVNNPSNINVQTNISGSHNIDSSSNVSVNTSINGVSVGYGLNGSDVLNVVDAATADAANTHAASEANASAAVQVGLWAAQMAN